MSEAAEQEHEGALLRRAQGGDRAAFAALCERHRQRIWRLAAGVTVSVADADDLAQEAIIRALRSLRSFRGEASFAAWICRITLNAAHDFQRSAWKQRVRLLGESANDEGGASADAVCPAPHEALERRELQRRVRAAVAALGSKERVPIYLIYFEQFSLAEVARLEGIAESTVRSRVNAGLRRLGRALEDLDGPESAEREIEGMTAAASGSGALSAHGDWKGCLP